MSHEAPWRGIALAVAAMACFALPDLPAKRLTASLPVLEVAWFRYLALGASLNLTVTAEGVEREGQLEWLRSRGCDEVQGFLLARPLSAEQLEEQFLTKLHTPAAPVRRASH